LEWINITLFDGLSEDGMTIEYDDNGKFYTDVISKIPVSVMIQTVTHRIHGNIHVSQDRRLKDELDLPDTFVAVTEAVIYSLDNQILYQASFLAVRRGEIVWVMPVGEDTVSPRGNTE
jgi:hypothetical protein